MAGKKKNNLFKEFKEFITKGNVLDMAVGIIIGSAFTAIVNSLVSDILNPFINTILGGFSFESMNVEVKLPWVTWMMVYNEELVYPVFNFGSFLSAIVTFLVTAIALFAIIKGINVLRKATEKKKEEEVAAAPTTKMCPFCKTEIHIEATRCPHCTSEIK